jgi:hypothetical protein
MSLKFEIVSSDVTTKKFGKRKQKHKGIFIQDFQCEGHTKIKYGALSAPLKEVLVLGFAWAYGATLPNPQNDEFLQLCEEVLSLVRERDRDDYQKRKTLSDHQECQPL